jgi:hypothetical protein
VKGLIERKRRWVGAIAGLILSVLIVASAGAQTAEIVQSITGGGQPTVTIDAVSLTAASYSTDEQYSPGQLGYTINAESGTAPGWSVSVQAGDLIYSGEHGGANIPAANLSVSAATAPGYVSGDPIDPANGPFAPVGGATGPLDQPRTVLVANSGYGDGSYNQNLNLSLAIPGGASPGSYSGTITFTVVAGP